jgi:hypothetical protein
VAPAEVVGMSRLSEVLNLAWQAWREDAACAGAPEEFVDPDPATADELIRRYCHRCSVVGHCRAQGDADAPHPWPVVMGARHYSKAEPVDGWEVA